MSNTWMVVAGDPAVGALVETGRAIGGELVALVVGPTSAAQAVAAGGVDRVVHLVGPQDAPYEAFAAAVAEQIAAAAPQIVLAADRPADRALAGAVAARTGAGLLGAVRQVEVVDGAVQVVRDALGGIVRERLAVAAPTVLVLDTGGLTSPLFFTIDFLLFGLSLLFNPSLGLLVGLALSLLFLLNNSLIDLTSLTNLISLILMAPLARFFGTQYLR
ncbi:MAG: hypothetical protein L6367_17070, partial [Cellulomonas sp.]|nr:hypothetical protein [Cellulomonas sp.]